MGYWEKIPNRPKSQKFRCSKCGRTCDCIKYEERKTVCDYNYCPYCGEPMESEGVGMTREKAIEVLNTYDMSEDNEDTEFKDALALAIKALEQEPCEDAISRQLVLDMMQMRMSGKELYKAVYNLPSVTPTRKKGKWIKVTETDFGIGYKCSECGRFVLTESIDGRKLKDYPYCHCGARMESEE